MTPPGPVRIVASHVNFSYGSKAVLHDVSVEVGPKARIGIVGESGSGKTTFAKLLVGAIDPHGADLTVNGLPWSKISRKSNLRHSVQMIQQDPFAALNPHLSARSAVREAVQVCRNLSRRESSEVADGLLSSVGISAQLAARQPRQLSGGQCQRVAIARALAADPAVLVADEPTSSLDLSVQAQIINLLLDVMAEQNMSLIMVSHDLAVIRHLTTEIVVMHKGVVLERGITQDVLASPQHPYTQSLCANSSWALVS